MCVSVVCACEVQIVFRSHDCTSTCGGAICLNYVSVAYVALVRLPGVMPRVVSAGLPQVCSVTSIHDHGLMV